MQENGASVCAHLAARVAELEAAHALLMRKWEGELVPRLLAQDEEIAAQREALTDLAQDVYAVDDDESNDRRRRRRAAPRGGRP